MPWIHSEIGCCGISVNVAPATLLESEFVFWLAALLEEKSIPMGWLQLEITEHALMSQAEQLAEILRQLRFSWSCCCHGRLRIRILFSDGTGRFADLRHQMRSGFRARNHDRFFPANSPSLNSEMGKGLGLIVTIEGVETQAELAIAHKKGADKVQGYFFSKAMHPDLIPAWIQNHNKQGFPDY